MSETDFSNFKRIVLSRKRLQKKLKVT